MAVLSYPFPEPDDLGIDETYLRLQRDEPVARVRLPYGTEAWLVTRYADIKTVMGDPRFVRAPVMDADRDPPRTMPDVPHFSTILSMDPPEHTRLRRILAKAFTARRTALLRERAQKIVDDLLDRMEEQGPPADLVDALAMPTAITLISEMLGVPDLDRAKFREWSDAAVAITAFTVPEIQAAFASLHGYLRELVEEKRRDPADDMLTTLVTAHDDEDRLSEEELVSFAVTLLIAGHETTGSEIANFTHQLLTHPERLAELRDDPSLLPAALEELLRITKLSGSPAFPRFATEDVVLGGVTIAAGEAVFADGLVANRDDTVFENPHVIDFHRPSNQHFAFGHGVHHCIGAPLARMELTVAIGTLLKRFPNLRLADEVVFKKGRLVRGPQSLPVSW
ncbi:cytochrome P450 [Saccharothrix violaceirubra]|uniref:Cytochrome P450 n=1 Tax=Saccharothrix violaceirubra TaxID=413306 RepID=A0A7W7T2Q9_9PSEU|nr:cytochrome P450 [Saccharothrix violaceirubra]MBB4965488.1 cytochrome P450 [Saccharothrix violaceirubra]